jgi:hypothetical protein
MSYRQLLRAIWFEVNYTLDSQNGLELSRTEWLDHFGASRSALGD